MQVRRLLNRDPGVVAVPDYGGPLFARPAAAPLIVQSQGSLMLINSQCGQRTSPSDAWFERRTYRCADHVQAVSKFAGVETLRLVGCSHKPLTVIPNVLNSPVFFREPAVVQAKSVLFATQCLSELKGTLVLAEAMRRVFEDVPGATLDVVGRDTKIGGRSSRQQFIELIPEARRPQVSFHDALSPEELAARMRAAGVVVVPSLVESFSLIALEAMGSGRPVVASRRGGLPEVVEDRRTGFLADPEEPGTFAGALRTLLLNPELAARMGQAGWERANAVYAPDQVYKRTLELHRELLRAWIPVMLEQQDTTSTLRSARGS
jgi:glycosyltransferase involved in cell wall biosynthesis